MRSRFRDRQEYYAEQPRPRIDTRPQSDPAVAAGMRNLHRDTRGNVIGGTTAEGQKLGTSASKFRVAGDAGSATPRLDAGVQTPRLDSNPAKPIVYGNAAQRRAQDVEAARRVAANGGFGSGAQQREMRLQGRQSLFRRMQTAGSNGITPDMEAEAAKLGVSKSRFRQVASGLPQAPAAIAATTPTNPVASVMKSNVMGPVQTSSSSPIGAAKPPQAIPLTSPAGSPSLVDRASAARDINRILESRKPVEMAGPPRPAMVPASSPAVSFAPAPQPSSPVSVGTPQAQPPAQAAASPQTATSRFRQPAPINAVFSPAPRRDYGQQAKEMIDKDVAANEAKKKRVSAANAASDKAPMPYGVDATSPAASVIRGFRRFKNQWQP